MIERIAVRPKGSESVKGTAGSTHSTGCSVTANSLSISFLDTSLLNPKLDSIILYQL